MRLTEIKEAMDKAAHVVGTFNDVHFDIANVGTFEHWNNTPNIEYPSIVVEIGDNFSINGGVARYTFVINAGDRRNERGSNDWLKWDNLAASVVLFLDKLSQYVDEFTTIDSDNNFSPLTQAFADNLAVVQTTITIETSIDICGCCN